MPLILAALLGAAIATIFSVLYHYFMHSVDRRSDAAMEVVTWTDDVYDRLITIYAQRDAFFTGQKFGLTNDEYRLIVKEVKAMLLASRMHTRVSLIYGKSPQLDKFDALREEYISIIEMLLEADQSTWPKTNQEITHRLNTVLEPLKASTERYFLVGARPAAILFGMMRPRDLQQVYLPAPEGSSPSASQPSHDTKYVAPKPLHILGILVIIMLAAILFGDRKTVEDEMSEVKKETAAPVIERDTVELVAKLPSGSDETMVDGSLIDIDKQEFMLKASIKNNGKDPLNNTIFIIQLPAGVKVVHPELWKNYWQDLPGHSAPRYMFGVRSPVESGRSIELKPPPQILFGSEGDYTFSYTIIADDVTPKTGSFTVRMIFKKVTEEPLNKWI